MDNTTITSVAESIPNVIKNTHLNVNIEGWPAVVSIISICGTCIACYAIKCYYFDKNTKDEARI